MTIWYILCSFGALIPFWYNIPKKSGNPALETRKAFFDAFDRNLEKPLSRRRVSPLIQMSLKKSLKRDLAIF
jgi:hypothetical protein